MWNHVLRNCMKTNFIRNLSFCIVLWLKLLCFFERRKGREREKAITLPGDNESMILFHSISISALVHFNNTLEKGEKSQRNTKRTHFFTDTPQKLTVAIGQAAVLLCRVKNLGNRTVSFTNVSFVDYIIFESSWSILAAVCVS